MDNYYEDKNTGEVLPSDDGYQVAPPPSSYEYDSVIRERKVNNFLSQTSSAVTLEKISYLFQGYIYDQVEKTWKKLFQPIPEDIRNDFLQCLSIYLTDDIRMTRLSVTQINGIIEILIHWSADYLDIKADEKELSEEDMTRIGYIFLSAALIALSRALNGTERDKIYSTLRLGDNFSDYIPKEKESFLGNLFKWK
ncbi:hypothetical protein C0585_00975 [Candidatus Woesearchaeota archaeon]|uniref:hypothetical protein n=1 Tax=uncultured Arcobacter sp. TaxID=165434 RepID=UPI000CA74DB7|nr:hypothetical protein [uncultured Arcobacter sp.]PLW80756.1 MAG: hypothetical protein C0585_00975 [Candidatus Woesearchaeota archaeon]